jgi:hypothetical protein
MILNGNMFLIGIYAGKEKMMNKLNPDDLALKDVVPGSKTDKPNRDDLEVKDALPDSKLDDVAGGICVPPRPLPPILRV